MSSGMRDAYGGRMFGAQKGFAPTAHKGWRDGTHEPQPLLLTRIQYGARNDGITNVSKKECQEMLDWLEAVCPRHDPTNGGAE